MPRLFHGPACFTVSTLCTYTHWSPTVPVSVWFKRRFLPHHMSQRRDIWCTNSPVLSWFDPKFVDRSVPYEAKQRRVKFRRCFGNIPLAECNVSVPNVWSSGTEPKAPVTDYRNRGSGNHTRGWIKAFKLICTFPKSAKMQWVMIIVQRRLWDTHTYEGPGIALRWLG